MVLLSTSTWPPCAAACSAVEPKQSALLGLSFWESRSLQTSTCPCLAAYHRADPLRPQLATCTHASAGTLAT